MTYDSWKLASPPELDAWPDRACEECGGAGLDYPSKCGTCGAFAIDVGGPDPDDLRDVLNDREWDRLAQEALEMIEEDPCSD